MDRTIYGNRKKFGPKLHNQDGPKNVINAREPSKEFHKSLKEGTHHKKISKDEPSSDKRREDLEHIVFFVYIYIIHCTTTH